MNMVQKYYMFLVLILSVLFVVGYDYNSDKKVKDKQKTKNAVVSDTPISIEDTTTDKDINLKYEITSENPLNITHNSSKKEKKKTNKSKENVIVTSTYSSSETEEHDFSPETEEGFSPIDSDIIDKPKEKVLVSSTPLYNFVETKKKDFSTETEEFLPISSEEINKISSTASSLNSFEDNKISAEKQHFFPETKNVTVPKKISKTEKYVIISTPSHSSYETEKQDVYSETKEFIPEIINNEISSSTSSTVDETYSSFEDYTTSTEKQKFSPETRNLIPQEKKYNSENNILTSSTYSSYEIEKQDVSSETGRNLYTNSVTEDIENKIINSSTVSSLDETYSSFEDYITSSEKETFSSEVKKEEVSSTVSSVYVTSTEKQTFSPEAKNFIPLDSDKINTISEGNEVSSSTITYTETTTPINICETAKLANITIIPAPFSLNITWINSVTVNDCKYNYEIKLNTEVQFNTSDLFILINYLNACKYYEATISIIYKEISIFSKDINATTTEEVDPVERINFDKIESKFKISWLPSIRTESCIKYYKWIYFKENKQIDEKNVTDTSIIISQPKDCLNHTFLVSAVINETFMSSPLSRLYLKIQVNDPPKFISAETNIYSISTKWESNNTCKPKLFWVNVFSGNENVTIIKETINDTDKHIIDVNNLFPFTNYSFRGAIENEIGLSDWSEMSSIFQTNATAPDAPEDLTVKIYENNSLYISWQKPPKWNGQEMAYILSIEFIEIKYNTITGCSIFSQPFHKEFNHDTNNFTSDSIGFKIEPASLYTISISAKSSGGISPSIDKNIITNVADPDEPELFSYNFKEYSLKNTYNVSLQIEWRTPCRLNGNVTHYEITLDNCNDNTSLQYLTNVSLTEQYNIFIINELMPETCYNLNLKLVQSDDTKYSEVQSKLTSPAGVPDIVEIEDVPLPNATINDPETTANVYIKNDMFHSNKGQIIYYAIIVAEVGCEEKPTSDVYSLGNWPKVAGNEMCSNESKAYQATKTQWNPFNQTTRSNITEIALFVLGTEKNCNSDICNRPLKPNTNYTIKIRGFTRKGFSDTQLIYFNTASFVDSFQLGVIVSLIVGILAIAFIIAAALFYTKGKLNFTGWPRMESNSNISPAPLPVPLKKFKTHYAKMIENSGKIKNEFQLLSTISSDVTLSTKTAMLPINRKKNRYINILPYDQTRVKLNDTSITASDYINASFIKGYTDYNEYIATQGPTELTSTAFWQMIIEQNVKIIVMLTQFVESGKDKCYKYFPDLNQSQDYLNVIKVECIEENLLSNYNRRIFKVIKGKDVLTVTHLQFNLWPDFGVPREIHHIIDFNKAVKDIKSKKPSFIVMHCSAGVGRTGTLIAVDILMQTIKDKRKVDIFGTVLNLRKQRMNMVQSEVQYEFLYRCVNYLLSDNTRTISSSRSFSKLQLDQIEENQITTESNILETFKL